MRLIDADALKKEVNKKKVVGRFNTLLLIDNAPTVIDHSVEIAQKSIELGRRVGRAEETIKSQKPQGEWVPVSERLPEKKINPNTNDFVEVLCSTVFGNVRVYKYGKPMGYRKAHFWDWGEIMDEYIIAWQPLPEPYKKGGAEC